MQFDNAQVVEQLVWQMRLADYPRGVRRSKINSLFNGDPPYNEQQARENNITINYNDMASVRLAHEARQQMYNSILKPGNYFTASTDVGPVHKRQEHSTIVTREINRLMKDEINYFEKHRSTFASTILHGIGPCLWPDRDSWCPVAKGIEDIMVPSNTLLTLANLPFFAVFESYTFWQLYKVTHGPKVDPGWRMSAVDAALRWAYQQSTQLLGSTWPEIWSPEKFEERLKQDSGFFASDAVPTIDCWRLFFYDDSKKTAGWKQRIVLDSYSAPIPKTNENYDRKTKTGEESDGFLFSSGDRIYASDLRQLVQFQFADLSAVAPFRYHTVRSLGFLIYAPCHLQNRLRCKFNEAVFEALMLYFRIHSQDDVDRAVKLDLINRGFIDDSIEFVKPGDRWQVNAPLVELGLDMNSRVIDDNAGSYSQKQDFSRDKVEKTKFQVQAEVSAMTSLISAALLQAYEYQKFEYREIFRRFCKANSKDKDVRSFRVRCLKQGVPEDLLNPESWNIEPERVMGAGNKTMETAVANWLIDHMAMYDPEGQRIIKRMATLAITDSPGVTAELVPDKPQSVNPARIKGQLAASTLLSAEPMSVERGIDYEPYAQALIEGLAACVGRVESTGGVPESQKELIGLGNLAQHIAAVIGLIEPENKQLAKQLSNGLGELMNLVKAQGQRFEEQQQSQNGNGNGGVDAETQAKLMGKMMIDKAKAENLRESHGQRTAQKQVQFDIKQQQDQQKHALEMQREIDRTQIENAALDLKTAAEIKRDTATPKAPTE